VTVLGNEKFSSDDKLPSASLLLGSDEPASSST
jgi:hypothetical protein